jgi:hypothetical protein
MYAFSITTVSSNLCVHDLQPWTFGNPCRFLSPVVIAPTIIVVGLGLYEYGFPMVCYLIQILFLLTFYTLRFAFR